jgi:hypothetical protein
MEAEVIRFIDRIKSNQYGVTMMVILVSCLLIAFIAVISISILSVSNIASAKNLLENNGYVVLSATEYDTINIKLDNIKTSADTAVINADNAVTAAENAVTAAQSAAAKVDLFNSAEVFLFPDVTNITITLTAGNTNAWSDWVEVTDSTAVTLSSKFATKSGYINDLYVYDHSAVDKIYCIELSYGASKTTLGRIMWHTSFKDAVQIKTRRVPAGSIIYYRMMCSGAISR